MTIEVKNFVKTYPGKVPVHAVRDISFAVERGEIYGFLGPNGAGKTTTIRCMLDLIRPTSGTISIFGLDAQRDARAIHARIGYLPGDVRLPGELTAKQFLERYSHLAGLQPVLLPQLLERFPIPLDRKIKGFSKGMRQMVAIIQAFMCAPQVAILDEPTSGLDPLGQRAFNDFLQQQSTQGLTAFMSSHMLSEVERICQRVAVIRAGELVAIEEVERLRERAGQVVIVQFADAVADEGLRSVVGVQSVERQKDGTLHLRIAGAIDPIIKALARHSIVRLAVEEAPLEDVFLKFYSDGPTQPPVDATPASAAQPATTPEGRPA
jgi:ABC-2 type transport system ATP-binding protein